MLLTTILLKQQTSQEGWSGERGVQDGGGHMYLWPIHADARQKPSQYCKVIILQLNKLIKKVNNNCSCPTFPLCFVLLWLAVLLADIMLPVLTLRCSCP